MILEHVALYTDELERMKDFYIKYFQAIPNELYHNKTTGLKSYFMSFDDGTRLELMTRPDIEKRPIDPVQMGYIHICIQVGSEEAVNELTKQLEADGYHVVREPRTTGDGYYESSVRDPDGNRIEIMK